MNKKKTALYVFSFLTPAGLAVLAGVFLWRQVAERYGDWRKAFEVAELLDNPAGADEIYRQIRLTRKGDLG